MQVILVFPGGLHFGLLAFEEAPDPQGSLGLLCLPVASLWYIEHDMAERERMLVPRIYRLEQHAAGPQNEGRTNPALQRTTASSADSRVRVARGRGF